MRLYWNRARNIVVVTAFDLPPAPAGRTYQLWAIEKGRAPVSVGTFNPPPNGRAVITLPMPAGLKPDLSAVTEEPAGRAPPTHPQPLLLGYPPRPHQPPPTPTAPAGRDKVPPLRPPF